MSVSFFSFGPESRNSLLVASLLADIFPACTAAGGLKDCSVFSQNHLYRVDGFTVIKRLRDLPTAIEVDMEQTIMVDDMACSVCAPGEERNFLPVYSGEFQFTGAGAAYPCGIFQARRDNSLVRVLGTILWCIEASKERDVSLVEALTVLQWDLESSTYRHRQTNSERIYSLGLAAMRRFNPEIELLDTEKQGFLPWSPPLAVLNPASQALVLSWYRHFGFDEEQVRRIVSSGRLVAWREEFASRSKPQVTVVEIFGGFSLSLPRELSDQATKHVSSDVVNYGLEKHSNIELACAAPGRFKLRLKALRLCDFDEA
ncbi:hypothetical protein SELMODRAFT_407806 [Selaginella moellendorffii]|uniref:Uncharacterized protein n=1 Tax=Selaginella moellendorffii TaxID=88036 RepID=D8R4T8_SELML|nr:hypothetical protein SELMODRAFT_407806 [Selaginella moellendorffii]